MNSNSMIVRYGSFQRKIWKKHLLLIFLLLIISPISLLFLHLYSYHISDMLTIFILSGMSMSLLPKSILVL